MYRQYENPHSLETQLREEKERQAAKVARGEELDEFDYERIADLNDRICFAWQDEEFEEDERRRAYELGELTEDEYYND